MIICYGSNNNFKKQQQKRIHQENGRDKTIWEHHGPKRMHLKRRRWRWAKIELWFLFQMSLRGQFRETEISSKTSGRNWSEYEANPWEPKFEKFSIGTPMELWFNFLSPPFLHLFYKVTACALHIMHLCGAGWRQGEGWIQICMTRTLTLSSSWFVPQTNVQSGFWCLNKGLNNAYWKNGVQRFQSENEIWVGHKGCHSDLNKCFNNVLNWVNLVSFWNAFIHSAFFFYSPKTYVIIKSGYFLTKASIHHDCL